MNNESYVPREKDNDIKEYLSKLNDLTEKLNKKDVKINSIQEDYKKIFNLFSDAVVIIDEEGTVIDLNKKAQIQFTNIIDDGIIGKKWKNIVEFFGCKWNNSIEKKAIEDNNINMELVKEIYLKHLNKYFIISIIPIRKKDESYFIFIAKDVDVIKKREIDLIKKQNLLTGIEQITDLFTKNLNINYIMERVVEILMSYVENVDMCYIYKNCYDINGELYAERIKECYDKGFKRHNRNMDIFYYKETFPRWYEYFKLNHIVCGSTDIFPENERSLLKNENIKSICLVPIYTPIELWGFVGFDSINNERIWSYDEERILKIAAHVVGAGIYQWSLRNKNGEFIKKTCLNFPSV